MRKEEITLEGFSRQVPPNACLPLIPFTLEFTLLSSSPLTSTVTSNYSFPHSNKYLDLESRWSPCNNYITQMPKAR